MKHLINLFLFLVPFVTVTAQKIIDEGYVKMEIIDVKSDKPELAMQLEMAKGSITEVFFTKGKYKTATNSMGGMFLMEDHVNVETKKRDLLTNLMGNKTWIDTNLEEENILNPDKLNEEDFTVEYDKTQTKDILGYKTYKVTITAKDKGMSGEGWITDQIKTDANLIQGMKGLNLEGFPLEFTVTIPMMKGQVTVIATEIRDSVDESDFILKTDGYTKKTMKEFTDSMGGMSGMF